MTIKRINIDNIFYSGVLNKSLYSGIYNKTTQTIDWDENLKKTDIKNDDTITTPGYIADARTISSLKDYINTYCLQNAGGDRQALDTVEIDTTDGNWIASLTSRKDGTTLPQDVGWATVAQLSSNHFKSQLLITASNLIDSIPKFYIRQRHTDISYGNWEQLIGKSSFNIVPLDISLTVPDGITIWHQYIYQQFNMIYVILCFRIDKEIVMQFPIPDSPFITGFPSSPVASMGTATYGNGMGTEVQIAPYRIQGGTIVINSTVLNDINTNRIGRFCDITQFYPISV